MHCINKQINNISWPWSANHNNVNRITHNIDKKKQKTDNLNRKQDKLNRKQDNVNRIPMNQSGKGRYCQQWNDPCALSGYADNLQHQYLFVC